MEMGNCGRVGDYRATFKIWPKGRIHRASPLRQEDLGRTFLLGSGFRVPDDFKGHIRVSKKAQICLNVGGELLRPLGL